MAESPPDPLFFLTPVDAPKNDEQDGKGCKHLILREKAVRPDEAGCNIIEGKLHQSHENGDGVNAQKIFFPVVRVKKTLRYRKRNSGAASLPIHEKNSGIFPVNEKK